ncbi:MAG: TolC family protein, partial [Kangiellaceae bacterium]|nr:TolC family protein [Kangiellaceae bacterium]
MNIIISAFKMSGFICTILLLGGLSAYANEKPIPKSPDINLRTALKLTLAHHPELQRFPFVIKSAEGLEQQSRITPLPKIEAGIENLLGSENFSGTDSAELNIAFSQVFEDEDKVSSRFQYASAKTKKLRAEFVQAKLQLLAETSRRYYQLLYLQQSGTLKLKQIKDYQTALSAIKRRAKAGAAALADVTRVELLLAQAQSSQLRLITQRQNAKYQLASMWQGQTDFEKVVGQFQSTFSIPQMAFFNANLKDIPIYVTQQTSIALANKKLAMEKNQSESDMNFSVGLRHHQLTSDQSLNFGFSMPLSTRNPNQGKINSAQAALEQATIDNQMLKHQLELNFAKYREQLVNQTQTLTHHQKQLAPLARKLLKQVKQGFDKGQFSVLQWVDASLEYYQQQESQLSLQHQIHLTVLELERLLG